MVRHWREKYPAKIEEYKGYLRAGMQKYNCDHMEATIKLVALLQEKEPYDSGMAQALLLATCVEMTMGESADFRDPAQ